MHETLTGFKWLGNWSSRFAQEGLYAPFAFEEAIGFALGELIRDKDGISAAAGMRRGEGGCSMETRTISVACLVCHVAISAGICTSRASNTQQSTSAIGGCKSLR